MTISYAIEYITTKLSYLKPGRNDVKAINTIIDFVDKKHKKQIMDNELFAKLYIYAYATFLDRYKATVFDEVPVKELSKFLAQPLDRIILRFTDKLNESEQYAFLSDLNIGNEHPSLTPLKEKETRTEALKEALKDKTNQVQLFKERWDNETIKNNLQLPITQTHELLT